MINKTFTWRSFTNKKDAFAYANKAMIGGATYIEVMLNSPRYKELDGKYIVQHNARGWIK